MSSSGSNTADSYSRHLSELSESRSKYETISRNSSVGVAFADLSGRILSTNNSFWEILPFRGIKLDDFNIFSDIFHLTPENSGSVVQKLYEGNLDEFVYEMTSQTNGGEPAFYRCQLTACLKGDKSFQNFVATVEQLDSLKNAETKRTGVQLEKALTDAPVAIGFLSGEDFIIESANKSLLNIWGKNETVIGKPLLEGLPEIKDQPFPALLKEVLHTGVPFYGNETAAYLNREKPMEEGFYNFIYYPVQDSEQNMRGVLLVVNEVTELVRAKNDLARREQRFRELIEDADVSIAVYKGRDMVIELANDSMLRLWGKGEEVRGKKLREALPELEGQPFFGLLERVFDTGEAYKAAKDPGDLIIDGKLERFYFNFSYKPMFDASGNVHAILNMAIDVTENVRAAAKLEESERRARLIIEAAELGIYELDYRTGVLTFSARLREIFEIAPDAEASHQTLIDCLHPDDIQIRTLAHERALKTGEFEYTARIIVKSGTIKWVRFTGKVRMTETGDSTYLYGVAMDVTAAKQEEIRKNAFVSMASHELKTPLTTIKGYIQLLNIEARKSGSDFLQNVLGKAERQANKMVKMVSEFLDLSKIETNKFKLSREHFNIADLVEEIIDETKMISGFSQIISDFNYQGKIYADKEKLGQVLSNFLSNAIKYGGSGNVSVGISEHNNSVKVSVQDQGPGIRKEDQSRVFDRYYRIEDPNNANIAGFGIGLYICAEIIALHDGEIGVTSNEGRGSTFYFTIKKADSLNSF